MSQTVADSNLLFGILALQMDFIGRDELIAAMHAWVLDKRKRLGEILVEQKALTAEERALLEPLVRKHVENHGNDPQQSLASLTDASGMRQSLKAITDPELEVSLNRLADSAPTSAPGATGDYTSPRSSSRDGRFRILRPHARGGLGEVFVARDEELRRDVALKQIQDRFAADPESRARFLLEAEVTGGLEHPGIVPVYGLGAFPDGRPFYAMRFIRGDSLKEAIERFHRAEAPGRDPGERTLERQRLLRRFIDVCNAIAYAHSRGIVHRDLKPGNVMLGPYGETLVVDWGLAKPVGRKDTNEEPAERTLRPTSGSGFTPTQVGAVVGTPQFMSPEQAAGRLDELGPSSDVYSLGTTLYCLLTGQAPFSRFGSRDSPSKSPDRRLPAPSAS